MAEPDKPLADTVMEAGNDAAVSTLSTGYNATLGRLSAGHQTEAVAVTGVVAYAGRKKIASNIPGTDAHRAKAIAKATLRKMRAEARLVELDVNAKRDAVKAARQNARTPVQPLAETTPASAAPEPVHAAPPAAAETAGIKSTHMAELEKIQAANVTATPAKSGLELNGVTREADSLAGGVAKAEAGALLRSGAADAARLGVRGMAGIGTAMAAAEVVGDVQRGDYHSAGVHTSAVAGGWAGAEGGAMLGAGIGAVVGLGVADVVTVPVGTFIGGIGGGIAGAWGAGKIADKVLPGTAVAPVIPEDLALNKATAFVARIEQAQKANPQALDKLLQDHPKLGAVMKAQAGVAGQQADLAKMSGQPDMTAEALNSAIGDVTASQKALTDSYGKLDDADLAAVDKAIGAAPTQTVAAVPPAGQSAGAADPKKTAASHAGTGPKPHHRQHHKKHHHRHHARHADHKSLTTHQPLDLQAKAHVDPAAWTAQAQPAAHYGSQNPLEAVGNAVGQVVGGIVAIPVGIVEGVAQGVGTVLNGGGKAPAGGYSYGNTYNGGFAGHRMTWKP